MRDAARWVALLVLSVALVGPVGTLSADPVAAAEPGSAPAGWAPVAADEARSYHVDYDLQADGSVRVSELIAWEFPGGDRHGIERYVTVAAGYQDRTDVYRAYEVSDVTAASPSGAPTDVGLSTFGTILRIRVGSPDITVSGVQDYVVSYTVHDVLNDIGDGTAEFYYDTIDSSNTQTYRSPSVSVTAPAAATQVACYRGPYGSTEQCDATAGTTSTFASADLVPGDGMTVIASYPREAFGQLVVDLREQDSGSFSTGTRSSPIPRTAQRIVSGALLGTGVLVPLLAGAGMFLLHRRKGRDEWYVGLTPGLSPGPGEEHATERGALPTIAVQFTPPAGVTPGLVGVVQDESADTVDVSATLVDLAVRGYLTIEETEHATWFKKDDWRLTTARPPAAATPLSQYEESLYLAVFAGGSSVLLSELKNTFKPKLDLVRGEMYSEVVRRGWFVRSPQTQRAGWYGLAVVLFILGIGTFTIGTPFMLDLFPESGLPFPASIVVGAGLIVAAIITGATARQMSWRTARGSAVLAQSLGFRRYLETAEAGQIRFEEAESIFSRYLPYAIVFGVAERWAQTFEEVATAAAAAGVAVNRPIWYLGHGDFSYGRMADSMDTFATTAAGTFVSTPGSSGGSGFSSSGGFSGGGGGGGGGGSW